MEYLEKICCFFIFARVFLHMCPNETYEKYLSALTSWIVFCIFLSPFLSGDIFWESYRAWEKEQSLRLELKAEQAKDMEELSAQAASEIVEEMGEDYEMESDR